jgi:hypothetical protein
MPKLPAVRCAVLAGVLIATVPFVASSSAAGCPSWTDIAGDSTTSGAPDPTGQMYDANLDVVKATLTTTGDTVTAVIGVSKLNPVASDAGDEFDLEFTVAGKTIDLFSDRGRTVQGVAAPVGFSAGFYNVTDDVVTDIAAAPKYDTTANTVTITGKVAELKSNAGVEVAGKALTGLSAITYDSVDSGPVFQYDDAAAPGSATVTAGTPCGGGDPAPAPSPSPSPSPSPGPGTPPPPGFPANGCNTVPDLTDDAKVAGNANAAEPDLDITGLALETTATELKAFVRIAKLGTRPNTAPGHSFYVNFTVGGKTVSLITTAYDPAALSTPDDTIADATKSAPVSFAPPTYASVGGSYVPTGLKATYDVTHSTVVFSIPRKDLSAAAAAFTDGATLSALTVRTATSYPGAGGLYVDSTAAANAAAGTATWTVGDNACFGPAAGKLANTGKTSVQYTDAAAVAAKLTNADGTAVAGRTVKFAVGSVSVTAKTAANGVATAALNPKLVAGTYSLVTSFAGDDAAAKVELATPFTVVAETTKMALSVAKSGSARTVTATLRDDDGKPVAGRTVNWYVNGKKVGSAKTSSTGAVTLKTAKPTQTVTAEFVAVAGTYNGCKASAKV